MHSKHTLFSIEYVQKCSVAFLTRVKYKYPHLYNAMRSKVAPCKFCRVKFSHTSSQSPNFSGILAVERSGYITELKISSQRARIRATFLNCGNLRVALLKLGDELHLWSRSFSGHFVRNGGLMKTTCNYGVRRRRMRNFALYAEFCQ